MTSQSPKILVIGCASQDIVHLEQSLVTVNSRGGAGLYSALAAQAAGAQCTLLAPKPASFEEFGYVCDKRLNWIGPEAGEGFFPHLEIRHHGNDRATLCGASWGAESLLTPEWLPNDLDDYSIVHIAALSSAIRQLDFAKSIRAKSKCKISIGTYAWLAYNETELVRELLSLSDFVFVNENEANAIFEEPKFPLRSAAGQIIAVTRGQEGALIYTNDATLSLAGLSAVEFDPTGAGDTFAGTLLGAIANNRPLQESAELAIKRSALVITQAGPQAIISLH